MHRAIRGELYASCLDSSHDATVETGLEDEPADPSERGVSSIAEVMVWARSRLQPER